MRVIFMGTPDFSVAALQAIVDAGHQVAAVFTQPPRPAGRGKQLRPSPVQERAETLGLPVFSPTNLRDPGVQDQIRALDADVAVVVAYGLLLPQDVLDIPRLGCWNIHASLLPRWRGAAPIHRAIMAGDLETGVCIMQMEAGLDTGPVLMRHALPIAAGETTGQLHDRLAVLGAELIVQALAAADDLAPTPQPEQGVCYAHKIDKSEAQVNWADPADQIVQKIHGLSPFPGAWTMMQGERVKLHGATLADIQVPPGTTPGTALDDGLIIACGSGALRLLRLQRAGKSAQDAASFLAGFAMPKGMICGE